MDLPRGVPKSATRKERAPRSSNPRVKLPTSSPQARTQRYRPHLDREMILGIRADPNGRRVIRHPLVQVALPHIGTTPADVGLGIRLDLEGLGERSYRGVERIRVSDTNPVQRGQCRRDLGGVDVFMHNR